MDPFFISRDSLDHLFCVMRVSDTLAYPHILLQSFVDSVHNQQGFCHRAQAVEWITKILQLESGDLRDSSIRIFDTYLTHTFIENPSSLSDPCWTVFAAAASMLLACKMNTSHQTITATNFTAFKTDDIVYFERMMVMKIGGRMSAQCTPAYFLQKFLPLCFDLADGNAIRKRTNVLVGEFLGDATSMLFAPSTIAISSILVCLSESRINGKAFLDRLPDFFFMPNAQLPFFRVADGKSEYIDCQRCVEVMEKLPSVQVKLQPANSPTSVAAMAD